MPRVFPRHTYNAKPESLRALVAMEDETLRTAFTSDVIRFGSLNAMLQGSLVAMPTRAILDPNDPAILEDLQRIACAAAGIFGASWYPAGEEISSTRRTRRGAGS